MDDTRYPYVHVDVSEEAAEVVAMQLWELGAQGVEERDASTLLGPEMAGAGVTLVASFADDDSAERAARELGGGARVVHVVGDDWREAYKRYFKVSRVGQRLVVRPSWEPYEPAADDVVLTVDPGMAFGTGTHESTRLLLGVLDGLVHGGERVLDVGCGTGILAIAALRLGAAHADCIDVDPDAVAVTLENAEHNGVRPGVAASTTPVEEVEGSYPLVLANIQADVLIPLCEALVARVAPGGHLLLSGILTPQVDAVRAAFSALICEAVPEEGEWSAVVLRRPEG